MPYKVPSSFTAGRKISLGEAQTTVPTPVLTKGATAGTGGTFTAGSVFWVVTATDVDGETIASNEVTSVMTETSTQVLNWAAVAGATGYKVYRGTTTGVYTKRVITLGEVTTHTDVGNPGTSAGPPVGDSTAGPVVVYELGDVIPNAVVKKIRNLSSLLSRRWIIPNIDPHDRRTLMTTPTPTDANHAVRKAL